jgi:hypothetical protein
MMIKAEIFEDKALLLDGRGRVWHVVIGHDEQPIIQLLEHVPYETVRRIMQPSLARYVG